MAKLIFFPGVAHALRFDARMVLIYEQQNDAPFMGDYMKAATEGATNGGYMRIGMLSAFIGAAIESAYVYAKQAKPEHIGPDWIAEKLLEQEDFQLYIDIMGALNQLLPGAKNGESQEAGPTEPIPTEAKPKNGKK